MRGGSEQTWTMNTAESVPAATGKVKVAEEKDGNTKVKVEVEHLAAATDRERKGLDVRRLAEAG